MDIRFNKKFINISNSITPDPLWSNAWSGRKLISAPVDPTVIEGTKHLVQLEHTQTAKCIAKGRRIIFLGSKYGVIMVYQHIPDSSDKLRVCASEVVWDDFCSEYCCFKPSLTHFIDEEELVNIFEYCNV